MVLRDWVRLPTRWIQDGGLRSFRWTPTEGSNHAAALMTLVALAHRADDQTMSASVTYDQLTTSTTLSRAKVSAGLKVLEAQNIIARKTNGRSSFQITDYDPTKDWGKLPAKRLYSSSGQILFFKELGLRKPAELHALKLYLLFVARRERTSNLANISYDKIVEYAGIDRNRIKQALSLLAINGVVYAEYGLSASSELGVASAYRIVHVENAAHMGTRGRKLLSESDGDSASYSTSIS